MGLIFEQGVGGDYDRLIYRSFFVIGKGMLGAFVVVALVVEVLEVDGIHDFARAPAYHCDGYGVLVKG